MRRRAAAPESARNTRMQGAPSHSPMAVPTTPGNAMSESVWAASTASIVFDVTACVSSRWSRRAQLASAAATTSVATRRPKLRRIMTGLERPVHPDGRAVTVPVWVVVQRPIVGPTRNGHTHDREVHGEDALLEAREQHDARAVAAEIARRARIGIQPEDAPVTHDGSAVQRTVIGVVHRDLDRGRPLAAAPRRPGVEVADVDDRGRRV